MTLWFLILSDTYEQSYVHFTNYLAHTLEYVVEKRAGPRRTPPAVTSSAPTKSLGADKRALSPDPVQ
jgi:hypothetical protein